MPKLPSGIRKLSNRPGYEVRVRYIDPITGESRRTSVYCKTSTEAKEELLKIKTKLQSQRRPIDSGMQFGQWAEIWLNELLPQKELKVSTKDLYSILLKGKLLQSNLAKLQLRDIRSVHLKALLSDLSEKSSQSMLRNIYAVLSHLFKAAEESGLISANPLDKVPRPKQSKTEVRFLSDDEFHKLLDSLGNSAFVPVIRFISNTGLRRGEALGLSWSNVDFERKFISITASLDSSGRRGLPKSQRSFRTLDLNSEALEILKNVKRAQLETKMRLGSLYKGNPWNLVFTTQSGLPISPRNLLRAIQSAASHSGLNDNPNILPIGVHTLRHYVATRLLNNGVAIHVVSRILGHESITTTVDIYGHLDNQVRKQALDSLSPNGGKMSA